MLLEPFPFIVLIVLQPKEEDSDEKGELKIKKYSESLFAEFPEAC